MERKTAMALMEGYDFTRRLERHGPTCCIEEPALVTSSRRFEGRHPAAIVLGWIELHLIFHLGAWPGFLAKRYARQCRRATRGARHIPVSRESEPT